MTKATALSPLQNWLADAPETPVFRLDDTVISRADLLGASNQAARHLHMLGFRRGDVLALLVPDSMVWLQFLFAASRIGVLIVPISTRYRDAEIKHMLNVSRAKGIVVIRRFLKSDFLAIVQGLSAQLPCLEHVIALEEVSHFFVPDVPGGDEVLPGPYPDALLCTFSTSGTTGNPKLAAHSQSSIVRHAMAVARRLEINAQTMTLCALPLYGVLGFVCAMSTFAGGGCCVSQPVFNAEEAARILDERAITHFYGSDGLLDAVLRSPGHEFRHLRRGGFAEFAGLGRRLIDFAESRFALKLGGVYGSSECFALMATRDPGLPAEHRALPGGTPTSPDICFRIADPVTGALLAERAPGELQIRVQTSWLDISTTPRRRRPQ